MLLCRGKDFLLIIHRLKQKFSGNQLVHGLTTCRLHYIPFFRFVSSLWNCFSLFSANEYTPRSAIKDHDDFFICNLLRNFSAGLMGAYFYYWPLNKLSKVTTSVNHICIWLYNDKVTFWKKKRRTNTNLFLELKRTFSSMGIRRTKRKLYFNCRFNRR